MGAGQVVGFTIQIKGTAQQEAQIRKLERSISVLSRRRNQLNQQERKGIRTSQDAAAARARLNNTLTAQRNKLRDLNRTVLANNNALRKNSGFVKGVSQGIAGFAGPVGAALIGFRLLSGAVSNIVGIFRDFQKANSRLAAVLGTSRENIGALTEDSKRLGASTAFTASEVAGLQVEFAKLGFTETQILSATEATLDLAAAAGTDLANAAAIAGTTVRAFGAVASDTQRFVDVMAKSFSSSALDIEKFQESMKVAAPAARAVGQTVEKTTAQLGTLANAGISGSLAGTALRRTFIDLNKAGISLEDALDRVKNSQDKLGTATELVGVRAATAFLVLAEGTEQTAALEKELRNAAGTAQEMADTQLDNLDGSLTKLSSAWEGLVLSVEDGDGALSNFLQSSTDALTGILSLTSAVNSLDFTKPSQGARQLANAFETLGINMDTVIGLLDELDKQRAVLVEQTSEKILETDERTQKGLIRNLEIRLQAEQVLQKVREGDAALAGEQSILTLQETLARVSELQSIAVADSDALKEEETAKTKDELKKAQKEREKFAKLRLDLQRKTQDLVIKNIIDATERLIVAENVRFAREQEDAEKRFAGQAELNSLLLQQEFVHQTNLDNIRKDAAEKEIEDEKKRIEDLEKRIQEELNLEIEALEAARDLRILDFEQQDIDSEERNQLILENEIVFQEELLAIKQQFGEEDVQLAIDTERKKRATAKDTTAELIKGLEEFRSKSTFVLGAITEFFSTQEAIQLAAAGDNEAKQEEIRKRFAERRRIAAIGQAVIDGAGAVVKAIQIFGPPPTGTAAIAAAIGITAANIIRIQTAKFNRGGVADGPDHAHGGIDGMIRGAGGMVNFEGGEAIINKQSTRLFKPILSSINSYNGFGDKFETGGITPARFMAQAGTVLPSVNVGQAAEFVQDITDDNNANLAEQLSNAINDQQVAVSEQDITDLQRDVAINEETGEF